MNYGTRGTAGSAADAAARATFGGQGQPGVNAYRWANEGMNYGPSAAQRAAAEGVQATRGGVKPGPGVWQQTKNVLGANPGEAWKGLKSATETAAKTAAEHYRDLGKFGKGVVKGVGGSGGLGLAELGYDLADPDFAAAKDRMVAGIDNPLLRFAAQWMPGAGVGAGLRGLWDGTNLADVEQGFAKERAGAMSNRERMLQKYKEAYERNVMSADGVAGPKFAQGGLMTPDQMTAATDPSRSANVPDGFVLKQDGSIVRPNEAAAASQTPSASAAASAAPAEPEGQSPRVTISAKPYTSPDGATLIMPSQEAAEAGANPTFRYPEMRPTLRDAGGQTRIEWGQPSKSAPYGSAEFASDPERNKRMQESIAAGRYNSRAMEVPAEWDGSKWIPGKYDRMAEGKASAERTNRGIDAIRDLRAYAQGVPVEMLDMKPSMRAAALRLAESQARQPQPRGEADGLRALMAQMKGAKGGKEGKDDSKLPEMGKYFLETAAGLFGGGDEGKKLAGAFLTHALAANKRPQDAGQLAAEIERYKKLKSLTPGEWGADANPYDTEVVGTGWRMPWFGDGNITVANRRSGRPYTFSNPDQNTYEELVKYMEGK
jgi:hypothetical protein